MITTQTKKTSSGGTEEVQTGGATTLKPADLKFVNRQLITVGFAPEGTSLPKPPGTTISALVQVLAGDQAPVATTTTAPGSTPTTAPAATTTTAPATTTTAPPATTTTKPSSTTTTK